MRIRGSIIDKIRSSDWLPRTLRRKIKEVKIATERLKQQNLLQAINNRQEIRLIYRKNDGNNYKRTIIPHKIQNNLLIAECSQRQELRSFDISRIVNIITN